MKTTRAGALRIAAFALIIPVLALTGCSGASTTGSGSASASGAGAGSGAMTPVNVLSYSGTTISWLGYIADKKGYFKDNGINATFTQLPNGQQATSALLGKSVDVTILDPGNAGPLLTQGTKLTLLVNGVENYWTMVGGKNADSSDLKGALTSLEGKSVTAPSTAGSGGRMIRALTDDYGIPSDALTVVADPTDATLTSGSSAAVMTDTIGACRLESLGYKELMNFTDPPKAKSTYPASTQKLIGLAGLGFWTTPSWVSAHPAAAKGFQKAIEQSIAWASDPSNHDALSKMMRASDYNVSALNDADWSSCVTKIQGTYDASFSAKDASTWSSLLQSIDKIPALPATSEWFASGLPSK